MPARPIALALLLAAPALASGAERLVASFEDPARDDTGPGTYVPPGDPEFRPGDFDLRRFEVYEDGEDLRLEVTLGAPIRRPELAQRTNQTPIEFLAGVYLQNVDVYVDTDPTPGSGFTRAIPGRRVTLGGGRTWEHAVVITPQPGAARAVIEDAMGDAARRVVVVDRVQTQGRKIVATIPAAELGGRPQKSWGWSVHLSGARWEREFRMFWEDEPHDAYTLPVKSVREAWALGGAPRGDRHPQVIDVLVPPGVDQRRVLGAFGGAEKRLAEVPFVSVEPFRAPPPAVAAPPAPAAPSPDLGPKSPAPPAGPTVADVADDLVTISGPVAGVQPMQLGRVVDAQGTTVARIVVVQVLEGGAVARAVEGREKITRGARVVFGQQAPSP